MIVRRDAELRCVIQEVLGSMSGSERLSRAVLALAYLADEEGRQRPSEVSRLLAVDQVLDRAAQSVRYPYREKTQAELIAQGCPGPIDALRRLWRRLTR